MRPTKFLAVAACASIIAMASARADTIDSFRASGEFQSGSILSGSLTIDTTTGTVLSGNLAASAPESLDFVNFANLGTAYGAGTTYLVGDLQSGSSYFSLLIPSLLIDYTGDSVASLSDQINNFASAIDVPGSPSPPDYLGHGALTEVPEPTTLHLFGSGVAMLFAVLWLRRRALN